MHLPGVTLVFVGLTAGCFLTSEDEVARVTSPSGRLDAVLVETNGGATTSFGYYAYVVTHGEKYRLRPRVADLYGAGRSHQASGANLRWEGSRQLIIEYLTARQEHLDRRLAVVGSDTISVSLRSGVIDTTAPGGGMLYNLEKPRH